MLDLMSILSRLKERRIATSWYSFRSDTCPNIYALADSSKLMSNFATAHAPNEAQSLWFKSAVVREVFEIKRLKLWRF